ncbi:CRAL/TRIO domain-containing protein [Gonapodya prolifera JEL478]|uniref:CRAL/TRIO domain-containing protein n=1 Tax=Gonapodya prolifera (strain JEL478) TaxID=1344416 RepID=A0A139AEU0_GONPJ|nr:CRAL/TRIO domain-containing protein [Gonapodya prolifera JEL478]|eukprot:KXS15297.1 CRAL/TRIO domain-containing protein [Gonapodya prolifera JEL478]
MSANDSGHINNLSQAEERQLRQLWAAILSQWSEKDADLAKYAATTPTDDAPAADPVKAERTVSSSSASSVSSVSSSGARSFFGGIRSWTGLGGSSAPATTTSSSSSAKAVDGVDDFAAEQLRDNSAEDFSEASTFPVTNEELMNQFSVLVGADKPDVWALRFLRARKWNNAHAYRMLLNCLKWRQKVDVLGLIQKGEPYVGLPVIEKGKAYWLPEHDKKERPVIVVHVFKHDRYDPVTETSRLTVLQMELGRQLLCSPIETCTIIFDMTDFGLKNMDFPFVKLLVSCLEAYYPESLGVLLIVNAPWVFSGVWKIISPWIDPVVRSKIQFCSGAELPTWIDKDRLPKSLGGGFEYTYVKADEKEVERNKRVAADRAGKEKAEREWREAWDGVRRATREWIIAGDELDSITETETEKEPLARAYDAAKKLRSDAVDAVTEKYRGYHPYIVVPTLYNRNGMLPKV